MTLFNWLISFYSGGAQDPAPLTGPVKRRTQSLSALPKDSDKKVVYTANVDSDVHYWDVPI